MSALCVAISFDGGPVEAALEAMMKAASHRAVDGVGRWVNGAVGLGYLAHELGPVPQPQPLVDGGLALVASARLDNRAELSRALGRASHLSDAELLLAAYRRWGEACAGRLLGDFAVVICDLKRRRLFAARDPLAMRPLYYRLEPRRLLVASEVKQLLAAPGVNAEPNDRLIAAFLRGRYEPLDETFYRAIWQLPPGQALVVERGRARCWRYWETDPERRLRYRHDAAYAEHFRTLFAEAVASRLRSTRPVGLLLSGGVDSGAIASMAGWLHEHAPAGLAPLYTYSWALADPALASVDERARSQPIVARYNLAATDIWADRLWPLSGCPDHGPDRDEPTVFVYQELLDHACAIARQQGIGVLLSGDRGDLLFGEAVFDCPGLLRAGRWGELAAELKALRAWQRGSWVSTLRRHLIAPQLAACWPPNRLPALRRALKGHQRPSPYPLAPWLTPLALPPSELPEAWAHTPDPLRRQRYALIFNAMHLRGSTMAERLNARAGVGYADPWSDRRLVEFVLAVPQYQLTRLTEPKRLAREGLRGVIPEAVRLQLGKSSPEPLLACALRVRAKQTVHGLLRKMRAEAAGYLDGRALATHYHEIVSGQRAHPLFWQALALELWLRRYWS